MERSSWKKTDIYKILKKKESQESKDVLNLLENPKVMDEIETILDIGNSTPKDFTLHDSMHSYRVAQTIWELIPDKTKNILSEYELLLLLLSSYLHDIGMSPEFIKVKNHLNFLNSSEKSELNNEEINSFQKWIDENYNKKTVDIRTNKVDDINELNYILTYYIRHKHNDWSGEWILKNLKYPLNNYTDWISDLIKICKSHHWGLEELKSDIFNPIPKGKKYIHLRYLAICLRIADVLENDPERTPQIILKHRDIDNPSEVFWLKDHYFEIKKNNKHFSLFARPEKAYIHKAIEETAHDIEYQLKLCKQLINEKPLMNTSLGDILNDYVWDYEGTITKVINPKDNAYEYIDGAFRPKTQKILDLLGGSQLYGNPIWAIRELLQNAFDAVKEKIAITILNENKDPSVWLSKYGEMNEIKLSLEKKNDGFWLVCKDSGVGMTKEIITDYFLASGADKRHEIIDLERRCKKFNFNLGRTGQFGIGVLSYFMIAEKVIIYTKRAQNTKYYHTDLIGWRFEINGVHDFGELTKHNNSITGTIIELKLRNEIEKNIEKWNDDIKNIFKSAVIKSPCVLKFNSTIDDKDEQQINYGWAKTTEDIKTQVTNLIEKIIISEKDENEIISNKEKNEFLSDQTLAREALKEMKDILCFINEEGELPTKNGKYRIHIPYFKLKKGNSFFYLKENIKSNLHEIYKIKKGYFFLPEFSDIFYSLKGFIISADFNPINNSSKKYFRLKYSNVYIEIDFESIESSSLSVARQNLILDDNFDIIKSFIEERIVSLLQDNINKFENIYSSLNSIIYKIHNKESYWCFSKNKLEELKYNIDDKKILSWKEIKCPLTDEYFYFDYFTNIRYEGKLINQIGTIKSYDERYRFNWIQNNISKYNLGILKDEYFNFERYNLFPIIVNENISKKTELLNIIKIPEQWSNILFFTTDRYSLYNSNLYLNENSNLFRYYDPEILNKLKIDEKKIGNDKILQDEYHCFAYLLNSLLKYKEEKWIGLCEKLNTFLTSIFKKLNISEFYILDNEKTIIKVGIKKWEIVKNIKEIKAILTDDINPSYLITYKYRSEHKKKSNKK